MPMLTLTCKLATANMNGCSICVVNRSAIVVA